MKYKYTQIDPRNEKHCTQPWFLWGFPISGTNPVVCQDCNIEDAWLLNMIRDLAQNTAYTQCFLV